MGNDNKKQVLPLIEENNNSSLNPIIIFLFTGQGPQWNTMGLELYENEPIYKKSIDLLDSKLFKYYGYSCFEKFKSFPDDDKYNVNIGVNAQPAMLMMMVSLFELYKHYGVNPSFIYGICLGESAVAYCSGMIDIDTFCYLIYQRSVIQDKTIGTGGLLSVNLSVDDFENKYSKRYPSIVIGSYNAPATQLLAGDNESLKKISKELTEKGIFNSSLGSLASFHTSSQDLIKDEILNLNLIPILPKVPTFSTVTTNLFDDKTIFNSEYLFRNCREPVLLAPTTINIFKHIESNNLGTNIVFIELTPNEKLTTYLKQLIPKESNYFNRDKISFFGSLRKDTSDVLQFHKTIKHIKCIDDSYTNNN